MKDKCQLCNGRMNGVPGNENVVDGITMCDYCHVIILSYKGLLKEKNLFIDTRGQDLVEYVLLIALLALGVALAFPPIVAAITGVFERAAAALGG